MIFAHRTDIGRRNNNQDFFHVPAENEIQLAIVADGMGGHRAGEVASRKAVEAMLEYSEGKQALSPRELLEHAVSYANRSVFELAASDEEYAGMGTTIVAACFENESFTFANVGDSRLYHFSGERLTQLSSDHSLVEELVQSGVITRRQAEVHPQRNILTRAVGCTHFVSADIGTVRWKRGDIVMLCSDGLHGSVSEEEMERIIASNENLLASCDELTETALENGSNDNITVVLVKNTGGAA